MPSGAVAGSASVGVAASQGGGTVNPFWAASNWYFEPNNDEIANGSFQLTSSQKTFKINLNSNGFLRKYRCVVRSSGAVGGTAAPDGPWNLFQNVAFETPDGSQFFKPHTGYQHLLYQGFGRPWEGNPTQAYDYVASINPAFTFTLAPELRYTAGALANMDSRRLYNIQGAIGAVSSVISGSNSTAPTVTFASGVDTWAQPDARDLKDVPNQPVPGGVALQTQRQLSTLTLNGANSNNIIDARAITGNLMRLMILEVRDSNNVRQDYLTSTLSWTKDARTLANYSMDALYNQIQEFYGTNAMARPTGVYVFPRFFNPGTLVGQGWLETSGATNLKWQSTTLSTGTNLPGTVTILTEQVVPLQGLDYEYTNL